MRLFGWVYLLTFSLDAMISVVASFDSNLESLSNNLSAFVILITLVVFILSCLNKLKPRKLFLILSGYYLVMVVFGIILGILLVAKLGPESVPNENIHIFLREQFTWYWSAHWAFLLIWLFVASYGFIALKKINDVDKKMSATKN